LLVTVNNRLKFEIEIGHDLSRHPIIWLLTVNGDKTKEIIIVNSGFSRC